MIQISLSGREDLNKKIAALTAASKRFPSQMNVAVQKFAFAVLRDAKDKHILKGGVTGPHNIASRTGRLRSSINARFKVQGDYTDVIIGSNVSYAAIHEHGGVTGRKGTTVIKKRPFIQPALDEHFPKLKAQFREIFKRYPTL